MNKRLNEKQLKNLHLIVFDLDGTLLNDENKIGTKSIEYITALRNIGVRFSFATGRLHSAITDHAATLNIQTPLISLDGSLIKSFPEGKIIFNSYVKEKHVKKAIKLADQLLLKIALCHDEAIYYTEHDALIPKLLDKFGAEYRQVENFNGLTDKVLEIVIVGDVRESIKFVASKMIFPYSMGLNTAQYKSQRAAGQYYLEIRRQGCNKGTGLKRLIKYLKINIEETAVAGDWYNDRSLFDTDALKIAVSNAVPEILRLADFVTQKSNNEDGVAEFLEYVLKVKTK
ncbi:MAG: HAD family hydrolase [bacterium]